MGQGVSLIVYAATLWMGSVETGPIKEPPPIPYPFNQMDQTPLACGPACMAIVLSLLELDVAAHEKSLEKLARPDGATSFADMEGFLASIGLHTRAVQMTPDQLLALREVAVLQVDAPVLEEGGPRTHFTVYAGPVDKEHVFLFDPIAFYGRGPTHIGDLTSKWSGRALIVAKHPVNMPVASGAWLGFPSVVGGLGGVLLLGAGLLYMARRRRPGAITHV